MKRRTRAFISASFIATTIGIMSSSWSSFAYADAKSEAENAFREGRTLLASGDLERACAKFAESQKLDPAAGTLLNLGECLDKRGMAASARAVYLEAAKAAAARGRADWEKLATHRALALEKEVSILLIIINPDARLKGLTISHDGIKDDWNKPISVDPGSHTIEATAPGHKAWTSKITVAKASALRVEIPKLDEDFAEAPTGQPPPTTEKPPPSAGAGDDEGSSQRTIGLVVGGVGAGALIFGSIAGLLAKGKHDDAVRLCPKYPNDCTGDSAGNKANDSAKTFATFSTVGLIAGGALLVGGAVLFFTAPSGRRSSSSSTTTSSSSSSRWTIVPFLTKDHTALDFAARF